MRECNSHITNYSVSMINRTYGFLFRFKIDRSRLKYFRDGNKIIIGNLHSIFQAEIIKRCFKLNSQMTKAAGLWVDIAMREHNKFRSYCTSAVSSTKQYCFVEISHDSLVCRRLVSFVRNIEALWSISVGFWWSGAALNWRYAFRNDLLQEWVLRGISTWRWTVLEVKFPTDEIF